MAERRVEIRLSVSGYEEAARKLEKLKLWGDDLSKKKITPKVELDNNATLALERLKTQLDLMSKSATTLNFRVEDRMANLALDKLKLSLDLLDKKVANPEVTVSGIKSAIAEVITLNGLLNRLNDRARGTFGGGLGIKPGSFNGFDENNFRKIINESHRTELSNARAISATLRDRQRFAKLEQDFARFMYEGSGGTIDRNPRTGYFRNLFSNLGSRSGWGALFGGGRGGGAAGDGGGGGGPGGFVGFLGSPAGAGSIAAALPVLASLIDALVPFGIGTGVGAAGVSLTQKYNPTVTTGSTGIISNVMKNVFGAVGPSIGMILANFAKGFQGLLLPLTKLFTASLPFIDAWSRTLLTIAKTILPALTQSLNTMARSGALRIMMQSFVILAKGIAQFIVALGPGMKAGAETFRAIAMFIAAWLHYLGVEFGTLGKFAGQMYTAIHDAWDKIRHETAVIFDGVRHEMAHIWDIIWNNTVGTVEHMTRDINNQSHAMAHETAVIYDGMRHEIAHLWQMIWSETTSTVKTGVNGVIGWFKRMSLGIASSLSSLGKTLNSIGHDAITQFWDGLKSVWTGLIGWVKSTIGGLPSAILHFFGMSPPHPGSAWYDLGANMMHHLEVGIKSRAGRVVGAIHGIAGGAAGGSAAAYAHALANRIGWGGQWAAINAVAMRESGWNMHARNPSSGAYGIAQFINGPSEYYQYGGNPNTVAGQVIAFFNYIRQRYGTPAAAWGHELRFGWYDQGGKLPPGLSLALNTTGHDEIHTGWGGGGDTYNIFTLDQSYTDAQALRLIKQVRKYKERHGNQPTGIG